MDEHVQYGWQALDAVGFPESTPVDAHEKDVAMREAGWLQIIDVGTEYSVRVEAFAKGSDCAVIWQYGCEQAAAAVVPNDGASLLDLLNRVLPLLRHAEAIQTATDAREGMYETFGVDLEGVRTRAQMVAAGYDRDEIEEMAQAKVYERGNQRAHRLASKMQEKGETREQFIEARGRYSPLSAHQWERVWDSTAKPTVGIA